MNYKVSLLLFSAILATASCVHISKSDVKAASKKLVGVNCITAAVYNLEDMAFETTYQIQTMCGRHVANSLKSYLDDMENLKEATGRVIDANDNECDNAGYNEKKDAQKVPSTACINKITKQMTELKKSLNAVETDLTDSLKTVTSACAKVALTNFQLSLQNFPTIINTCGSLTA